MVYVCHRKSCHTSCQRAYFCHTSSHTAQSLMAENVIALSYVRMTPPMTNRKIVKFKSYRRMTMLWHDFFLWWYSPHLLWHGLSLHFTHTNISIGCPRFANLLAVSLFVCEFASNSQISFWSQIWICELLANLTASRSSCPGTKFHVGLPALILTPRHMLLQKEESDLDATELKGAQKVGKSH